MGTWLGIGAVLLAGCGEAERAAEARAQAAEEVTLQSAGELESYVLTARTDRTWTTTGGSARAVTEDFELRWDGPDTWALRTSRDGRPQQRVILYNGEPWSAAGDTPLSRRGDPEPWRVQLRQSWDPWILATESARDRIRLTEARADTYEGRPARVYTASLREPPPGRKGRPAWEPTLVEGEVWLDEQTAVRLSVELHLQAEGRKETLDVRYRARMEGVGADAGVPNPQLEEGAILDRDRPIAEPPPRNKR